MNARDQIAQRLVHHTVARHPGLPLERGGTDFHVEMRLPRSAFDTGVPGMACAVIFDGKFRWRKRLLQTFVHLIGNLHPVPLFHLFILI